MLIKKQAILFINSDIDGYKIVRVYKKSFTYLLSYLKKYNDISRVYIRENELTLEQMQKLLSLKKQIALVNNLKTTSIISVENSEASFDYTSEDNH